MSSITRFDTVYPDEVIQAGSSPATTAAGVVQICPLCQAAADESPEGVYGFNRPVPVHVKNADGTKKYKVGDPVWEAEHCWKCGYRPGSNSAVFDEVKAHAAFKQWMEEQTADARNHPTQTGFNDAQKDQIQGFLKEALAGLLNPQQSVGDTTPDVGVRPGVTTEKG